jgi:type I restriction enzyme S subunit
VSQHVRKPPHTWAAGRLSDVIDSIRRGFSVQCAERPAEGSELGVLKTGAVLNGKLDLSAQKLVPSSQHNRLRTFVRKDTIILCRKNSDEAIGSCAIVHKDEPQLFLSDLLWEIEANPDVSARWLLLILQSAEVRREIKQRATGTQSSMRNISQDRLLDIPILIPPTEEQSRIAEILSPWNHSIEILTRQIEKKRRLFAALRESLVFGGTRLGAFDRGSVAAVHRRFAVPNDWLVRAIGSAADEISTLNEDGEAKVVLSCSKHDGFVRSIDYFKKQVFSKNLSKYKKIRLGDFGFPSNHVEEGSIGFQNLVDVGAVSPIYIVFRFRDAQVSSRFGYRVLKSRTYQHLFEASTTASVDRRESLRWGEFSILPFPLPPIAEQDAIADVLDDAERELAALESERAALERQYHALAAELLTGRLRARQPSARSDERS